MSYYSSTLEFQLHPQNRHPKDKRDDRILREITPGVFYLKSASPKCFWGIFFVSATVAVKISFYRFCVPNF